MNATGASDPETGIKSGNAGYTFSSLGGFLSAAQTGNHVDVTFDGSSTGAGAVSRSTANNNAGVSSAAAELHASPPTGVPTGGLLGINPYSGWLTFPVPETDFTDALSGIASNVVTRSDPQAPTLGLCPGAGYTGANAVTLPNDTVPADGQCYQYTLTGTDRVGNVATYRTNVLVDTTGPAGGSVSYADGLSSLSAINVDWDSGTDDESGIALVRVDRATASLSGSTCGSFGSFSTIVASATVSPIVDSGVSAGNCYEYQIVVTNNAGVSSTFSSPNVAQLTSASPITVSAGAPSGTFLSGSTLWLGQAAGHAVLARTDDARPERRQLRLLAAKAGALSGAASTASRRRSRPPRTPGTARQSTTRST